MSIGPIPSRAQEETLDLGGADQTAVVKDCINRISFVYDKFLQTLRICVNVLASRHQDLSGAFARYVEGVDRCAPGKCTTPATGFPVLADANVGFVCRI